MVVPAHSPRVYRLRRQRARRLLLILLSTVASFYFINSSFFCLEKIIINGNYNIPADELERVLGVEKGINLWHLDTELIEKRLATQPLVASAQVKRQWPRTLVVNITERVPVALIVQDGGFFLLDGSGVIMERLARIGHLNLPLISGIATLADLAPGQAIEDECLHAALEVAKQLPSGDLNRLQEIVAVSPTDLKLIWEGNIVVRFGDCQNITAKLARLQEALTGLDAGRPVEYIDVSYAGPPVVKYR